MGNGTLRATSTDRVNGADSLEQIGLPPEWEVVSLKRVTQKTHLANPRNKPQAEFKYVDVSSVSSQTLRVDSHVDLLGNNAPSRARKVIRAGDTIFATVRPNLKRVASVPPELDGQICSTAFCVIRPDPSVLDPSYAFFATSTDDFVSRVSVHQRGSGYPAVTDSVVLDQSIPLPPLPEQRAIAHVLRTVQQAREATEKVITATRELKKSLMRHLFTYGPEPVDQVDRVRLKETEIGVVPEHWKVVKLGELSTIGNGSTPKRTNAAYWEVGTIPWLTSAKIHESMIQQADEFVTPLARAECHLPLVPKGSLLVAITGQGKTLGNAALVAFDTCVSQHLAYIRFKDSKVVPEYMLAYLQKQYGHLRQLSQAGGSTKGALTCGLLKIYPVPLPLPDEQRVVAHMLSSVSHKLEEEIKRKDALDTLFQTLLHHLMTGKVRVQGLNMPAPEEVN